MTRRGLGDLATVLLVAMLLGATYVLPPDTSLRIVRERGVLRACVPASYPPLVTEASTEPGIDIDILEAIASRIGVQLQRVRNGAMGRDFNPRNWRVTRAQCQILAGGIVATDITRSFLETTPPHLETGWAIVVPAVANAPDLSSSRVGFVPGATGLDRIALSRFLRANAAETVLFSEPASAVSALQSGEIDTLATEGLLARRIATDNGWTAAYLPRPLDRYPIGFGLWKGDLTLKRAVVAALDELETSGQLDRIRARYDVGDISETCPVCE
jgi:polar amino acid transport system substrate-binding protein/cystine transport system substrate-binding protein/membrane-bound lytic murein transglycosylase F